MATSPEKHEEMETVVGHHLADETDVYIGRQQNGDQYNHFNNTPPRERGWLGNPYVIEDAANGGHRAQEDIVIVETREESVSRFTADLLDRVETDPSFRAELAALKGDTLGCWCQRADEDHPLCHGEALADVIDALTPVSDG